VPKKRLTEEMVRLMKPPEQGRIVIYDTDTRGLLLTINAGGSKTWSAQTYAKVEAKSGKLAGQVITQPSTHKLGRYPRLSLKEARAKAQMFDPHTAAGGTFAEVAGEFIDNYVKPKKLRTQPEIVRCLHKYVYPQWQDRRFTAIERTDVNTLIQQIGRDHRRQANIVLGILSKLMNWYAANSRSTNSYTSPIIRGMKLPGDGKRSRTLTEDEIRALWKVAPEMGGYGALCQVLLLTAQRRDKVLRMKPEHVVNGTWTIESEPREKGNGGVLRLPAMVREIIEAQPRIRGNPYLFAAAGWKDHRKPELDRRMKAELGGLEPWVVHDLRRTARTLMSKADVPSDHAERVMGHALPGLVGTYNTHDFVDQKAAALEALAAEVAGIVGVASPQQPTRAARKPAGSIQRRGVP
jgi:integrase